MKRLAAAIVIALIAVVATRAPSSAADSSLICRAQEVLPDGTVVLSTTPAFLASAGFERGDLVSLSVNGSTFVMPVCVGRAAVDRLQYAIVVGEHVSVQLRGGSFAESSLAMEGDEITIVMNAKGLLKYHHLIHELASRDGDAREKIELPKILEHEAEAPEVIEQTDLPKNFDHEAVSDDVQEQTEVPKNFDHEAESLDVVEQIDVPEKSDQEPESHDVVAQIDLPKDPASVSDPVDDPAMKLYRVIKGDCLWKISRREYGRGSRWPRIYRANIDSIDDPDLIYIDQLLSIPIDHVRSESR